MSYYAKDHFKFSTYAAGIQAPAVEGKTFTGWGFASNDGDVAVDPDAEVTGNWAVYPMYKNAEKKDDTTQNVVSFYAGTDKLIQTVGYYAKDHVKFSQYALGIQAPAVEGKIFTGWGFASNDGDVPVDPDMVVTGNWAVYAMYKDAPTDDSKKEDRCPEDQEGRSRQHRRYRWWRCGVRRDRPARLRRHHRAPQARLSLTQSRWHSPESD